METEIKILILEDNESDVELILDVFIKGNVNFNHLHVDNEADFRMGIEEYKPDIILSDYMMPGYDGMTALLLAKELTPITPVIIVTGSMNEEVAVECMKAGASDYIIKEHLVRLPFAVKEAINNKQNIAEREKVLKSLKESEERFRKLFDDHPAVKLLIDPDSGEIVDVNKAASEYYGWSKEELKRMNINQINILTPEEVNIEMENARTFKKNYFEFRHRLKNGSVKNVQVFSGKVELNGKDYLHSIVHDITEAKRTEEAVKESEERYRSFINSTSDMVFLKDDQFKHLVANIPLADFYGKTPDEIIGKTDFDLAPEDAATKCRQSDLNVLHSNSIIVTEEVIGNRFFETTKFPVPLRNNKVGVGGIIKEITERKRTEKELITAKEKAESANKLKDAFIANISHEIRTPLAGILGMTSIIKETYQSNIKEGDEVLFEGIDISSNRIIRTVDMILNYSRLHVGEFNITPAKINISLICTNLVKEFLIEAKNKSLDLSFQNNCGDTLVFADEYSINMAISNLIDNAIKFTNKGSVNVILHKEKHDDLILDVKDTGIGINQEYLNHIFEPYLQEDMGYGREYEGIGLGLAIVQKVFDLNKCVINVESKKDEGTTFSINFGKGEQLLDNKSKTVKTANILPMPKGLRKEVVLLVEDDFMNQVTIRKLIENSYNVIIADSSDEAMEILKKEKIDLILMDISIKGSKNGLELTKELKASKEFSHIPIIAVTAHAFASDRINSLAAGCDNYLSKPLTKESLLNMIALYAHK